VLPDPDRPDAAIRSTDPAASAAAAPLEELYQDFTRERLAPLWTQTAELMPAEPTPSARPHIWRWKALVQLAERAGQLVPVDRGGERRAIA
jgi:gentisate 1,2-dioxygenase